MNSQYEQPFQYKQLRSQSLSPYNDYNLIKQLKRQLHTPVQKTMLLLSFENKQNHEQIEGNIISSDSIKLQFNNQNSRRNLFQGQSIPINQIIRQSMERYEVPKKVIVPKNLQIIQTNNKQKAFKNFQENDINDDDDSIKNLLVIKQSSFQLPQTQSKRYAISVLPKIKKQHIVIEDETPIKRSERYEQLMKKTCNEQLNELQSLIKKIEKQSVGKKEKKVTFLI